MLELALLVPTTQHDPYHDGALTLVELDEPTVRWLRERLAEAKRASEANPRFVSLRFRSPEASFFPAPIASEPYASFNDIVQRERKPILVRRHPRRPPHYYSTDSEIVVQPGGVFWDNGTENSEGLRSCFVSEEIIMMAWCLLCPEQEDLDAFCELIRVAPRQALDCLEKGFVSSHDGLVRIPLPTASPEILLPLLEHEDPTIREWALTVIGPYVKPDARRLQKTRSP